MSCKYPKNSRSYKFCLGCSEKESCSDSTFNIPQTQPVKPQKKDESEIEKAIKLLIDNGYSVTKLS